jgi:hypothetical protein
VYELVRGRKSHITAGCKNQGGRMLKPVRKGARVGGGRVLEPVRQGARVKAAGC